MKFRLPKNYLEVFFDDMLGIQDDAERCKNKIGLAMPLILSADTELQ